MDNRKQGKIIKGVGGFYTVLTENGERFTVKARGLFRKLGQTPLPGDDVEFTPGKKGEGFMERIFERRSELLRPALANVDCLLICVSTTEPAPDLELADKLLLYCRRQGIEPVIVINKCDGGITPEAAAICAQYAHAAKVFAVSAETGFGMDALAQLFSGRTAAFAGQSAVGKSSLINALLGLSLKTGELSQKTERGRHTTRHAELIPTPAGGLIADTPGFSMLESVPLEPEQIPALYPEFVCEGGCRFTGCMHLSEPDCAVKAAVSQGRIDPKRYERYKKIALDAIEARRHKYD